MKNQLGDLKSAEPIEDSSFDKTKKFVKEQGWEIPGLSSSKKRREFRRDTKTDEGQAISIDVTDYEPTSELLTEEPFKSINWDLGLINIRLIKEFKIGGRKFCYKVEANRASIDPQTGSRILSGALFFFAFYDEDGDGKFESLVLDEVNSTGVSSFSNRPHIPRWTLNSR